MKNSFICYLSLLSLAFAPVACARYEVDTFGDLDSELSGGDSYLTSKSSYSADFDLWLKYYLAGQDARALTAWKRVLKLASRDNTLRPVMKQAVIRTSFDEGAEHSSRANSMAVMDSMVSYTERALGKNDWLLESAYDCAADNCMHNNNSSARAVVFKYKQLALRESKFGKDSPMLVHCLAELAEMLVADHKYAQAEAVVKRVSHLGRAKHSDRRKIAKVSEQIAAHKHAR